MLKLSVQRPTLDYQLTELTAITHQSSEFVIDGQNYKINVGGLYNIYNALAAVSVAEFFGVSPEKIKAGFNKSKAVLEDKKLLLLVINHAPLSLSRILLEPVRHWK